MISRLELTYAKVLDILDINFIAGSTIDYTPPQGVYGISDLNLMFKSLLPIEVKVNITIDEFRLRSNLITNRTERLTKRFLRTILGFTQSLADPQNDPSHGLFQKIPWAYKITNLLTLLELIKFF